MCLVPLKTLLGSGAFSRIREKAISEIAAGRPTAALEVVDEAVITPAKKSGRKPARVKRHDATAL
jgi:hypothetical protein